jgi:zinc protease
MRQPPGPYVRLSVLAALAVSLAAGARPAAGQQERFRRTPPLPETFRELRLPEIETSVLPNGLTVATNRRPGSPLVTLQLVIRAGEADSPNLPHTAALAARMIGHGSPGFSAGAMEREIEAIGGDFSVRASADTTVLTLHVVTEQLDRALDILRVMVLQPEFLDAELASVRRAYYYELAEKRKDPEFVGRRHLLHLLFANHPYHAATMNEDQVKLVTTKDVAAFVSRFYRPNNATFVVSGGFEAPAAVQKIGQLFGAWLRRDIDRTPAPAPLPNKTDSVCFIDFPTTEDFIIYAGNVVLPPGSPDYYPFLVLNQVLGGSMGSRLFMNLRESKGYAYEAFSEAEFFRSCGVYWARARVAPDTDLPAAVREIARELKVLSVERAVPDEIEQAKSFLIGNLPLKFATLEGYAEQLSQAIALGLGPGHWNRVSDSLMRVNADAVLEAAARNFQSPPIFVIVGNREWAAASLREFERVDVYDSAGVYLVTLHKGEKK